MIFERDTRKKPVRLIKYSRKKTNKKSKERERNRQVQQSSLIYYFETLSYFFCSFFNPYFSLTFSREED